MDPNAYRATVRNALIRNDMRLGALPIGSEDGKIWKSDSLAVHIQPDPFSDYGPKVTFRVCQLDESELAMSKKALKTLKQIILTAIVRTDADLVEWLRPRTLLLKDELSGLEIFKSAESEHQKETKRASLPDLSNIFETEDVDATSHNNYQKIVDFNVNERHKKAESRIKAAAWLITGTTSFLSPAVAGALAVTNARSADFRLSTQALSLAGTYSALQSHGYMDVVTNLLLHGHV
ncbi:hypothetical protein PRI8871_02671 [Pseudoprimorskyibacter insulae]|uniref:Uncharacterized protein n=2 Tax=Pseudoprimorskyibacter insulae TaxID=1695997 RepID=A0A2R8AXY3_9RHOB|nr:hypothetical protein PRI8871_02671 [Pseudoprimorskyibacter insulae]